MKITDVQVLQLAGPELPKVMQPAWAPGSEWRRWGGTIVKVFTDEGIVGLGSPGYGISPADRVLDQAAADRPGPVCAGAPCADLPQRRRRMGRGDRALGHHRQGVRPAGVQAVGRLSRPRSCLCVVHRGAARRSNVRRISLRVQARWLAGGQAAHPRLDAESRHRAGRGGATRRRRRTSRCWSMPTRRSCRARCSPSRVRSGATSARCSTARELERLGVYWLEEPLDRYDFDNLTRLAAAVDILIAGGENNCGLHEYRWLIERNCYDVLQPEAMVGRNDVADPQGLRAGGDASQAVRPASRRRRAGFRRAPALVRRHPELSVRRSVPRPSRIQQRHLPVVSGRADPARSRRRLHGGCRTSRASASSSTRTRSGGMRPPGRCSWMARVLGSATGDSVARLADRDGYSPPARCS